MISLALRVSPEESITPNRSASPSVARPRCAPPLSTRSRSSRRFSGLGSGGLPPKMKVAFYTCLLGMALLYVTLWSFEITHKQARARVRSLKRRLGGEERLAGRTAAPRVTAS